MVRESMILEMMAALLKCLARRSELAARYLEPDSRENFPWPFLLVTIRKPCVFLQDGFFQV